VSKDMVSDGAEFKFVIETRDDRIWFPENNIILRDSKTESRVLRVKTLNPVPVKKRVQIGIGGFGKTECIPHKVLEKYAVETWLGNRYSDKNTEFRLWSPVSSRAYLRLWKDGIEKDYEMKMNNNYFSVKIEGDLDGALYQYVMHRPDGDHISSDPWAYACSVNGEKSAVIDIRKTDPEGFRDYKKPSFSGYATDAIIYETHIRDISMSDDSGIKNKGKFLALSEKNTTVPGNPGILTGISHIRELGATHVHILPVMDFASVDETQGGYNWGYDPYSYFALEGSYSTEPHEPAGRIAEFKKMVKSLHEEGLRVVLDVVYNHTYSSVHSPLAETVPHYYYRLTDEGKFSNGSGCGNETASEHIMFRRHMYESMKFFIEEYRVDGFRFDLLALHDVDTMTYISNKLKEDHPDIILYGEPWNGGDSQLPEEKRFYKGMQRGLPISVFNDHFRNAVKGDTDGKEPGFGTGDLSVREEVIEGLKGAITGFAEAPLETVNYVTCHDNLTLVDKIRKLYPDISKDKEKKYNLLSNTIIMLGQGIPFIHGGVEFHRDKGGNHNSYNAPDEVNEYKWSDKMVYSDLYDKYRKLVNIRRELPCFRYRTKKEVEENIHFADNMPEGVISMYDRKYKVLVLINARDKGVTLNIPGKYRMLFRGYSGIRDIEVEDYFSLNGISAIVAARVR
ncbi:MAG: type I pullulanase, partial [Candidatus Muiribacteriaceae bacterium]